MQDCCLPLLNVLFLIEMCTTSENVGSNIRHFQDKKLSHNGRQGKNEMSIATFKGKVGPFVAKQLGFH